MLANVPSQIKNPMMVMHQTELFALCANTRFRLLTWPGRRSLPDQCWWCYPVPCWFGLILVHLLLSLS